MDCQISTQIVSKPEEEFLKYSDQRISGLKLTLEQEQLELYCEARDKGLQLLKSGKETV